MEYDDQNRDTKEEIETKISFWIKVKECQEEYEITDTVVIIFTLSLPITVGYIISINLSIISQIMIIFMIYLFIYITERGWIGFAHKETKTIKNLYFIILFGMIIGDIVYYFAWYDGSINWLSQFIPS